MGRTKHADKVCVLENNDMLAQGNDEATSKTSTAKRPKFGNGPYLQHVFSTQYFPRIKSS